MRSLPVPGRGRTCRIPKIELSDSHFDIGPLFGFAARRVTFRKNSTLKHSFSNAIDNYTNYERFAKASLLEHCVLSLCCGLPLTELNAYDEVVTRRPTLPMYLLIVDDEETTRELCATVAAQVGLRATSVSSAELALEVSGTECCGHSSGGPQTSANERPGSPQARE